MTHQVKRPNVTKHEPDAIIDDTQETTWDIVIRDYLNSRLPNDEYSTSEIGMFQSTHIPIAKMMQERSQMGFKKHGTHLTPNNGRDSLIDSVQEVLDFLAYTKNAEIESNVPAISKILQDTLDMGFLVLENLYIAWEMKQG